MRWAACKPKRGEWLVHNFYFQTVFEFFGHTALDIDFAPVVDDEEAHAIANRFLAAR